LRDVSDTIISKSGLTAGFNMPLERIASYLDEFRRAVEDCRHSARSSDLFRPEHWKNAYGALGRLRDRYKHEKDRLTPAQRDALQKVFENDHFIRSMMEIRQVGEHVTRRCPITLCTDENIHFECETSANDVFAAPIVTVLDKKGEPQRIDHLAWFEETLKRIQRAFDRARA
jgi:hypothetical protein